jgi:PAS domain S-box-containing protein
MARFNILIVEDEAIVARDLQNRLEAMGYVVPARASTGMEAIRNAEETHPDLVLMDIVLRGKIDGVEAARRISDHFDIPVIFLTAYSDEETVQRAKIIEPYGYIVKPFDDRQLQTNIEIAIYKHGAEKALRESEERFRRLAEATFEGIMVHDKGVALDMNDRLAQMFGYEPEELIGRNMLALVVPEQRQLAERNILSRNEGPYEILLKRKDGSVFPAEIVSRSIPVVGHKASVAAVRDITHRKQMEQLMKERVRSELYGFVVSALPLIVPGAYQEVRTDLLGIFANRFEQYFKPRFVKEMERHPQVEFPPKKEEIFNVYLEWASELFSNFGIIVTPSLEDGDGYLKFRSCPWMDYSKNNPVFCMLCRTMASRSFAWISPGGAVGLSSTIAGGGKSCRIEFRRAPIRKGGGV